MVIVQQSDSTAYLNALASRMGPLCFFWEAEELNRRLIENGHLGRDTEEIDPDEWKALVDESVGQFAPTGART